MHLPNIHYSCAETLELNAAGIIVKGASLQPWKQLTLGTLFFCSRALELLFSDIGNHCSLVLGTIISCIQFDALTLRLLRYVYV